MAQLSWRYHTLLQTLLSRGPLKKEEFDSVFSGVTGKNPVSHQQLFNECLLKINKELAYVQFELRGCRNQYDGKVYYGVVNNIADEQSKLGTKYSVPQIAFYKAVVEGIVHGVTAQGCITNIEALNIRLENQVQTGQGSQESQSHVPYAFKSFSITQKEKTLNDLIQDRWLCRTSEGSIGLGVRSFLDLRSWFHNNDIPSCEVCNEAGVKASTCHNETCTVRIHDYCLKKRFSQRKAARVCPGCGAEWQHLHYSEEEEETHVLTQSQMPLASPPTRKRLRSCKAAAVEALRSCKAEAVEAAQIQCHAPFGHVPRKKRSCKIEAAEAGPSQPTVPSLNRRRTRLSACI